MPRNSLLLRLRIDPPPPLLPPHPHAQRRRRRTRCRYRTPAANTPRGATRERERERESVTRHTARKESAHKRVWHLGILSAYVLSPLEWETRGWTAAPAFSCNPRFTTRLQTRDLARAFMAPKKRPPQTQTHTPRYLFNHWVGRAIPTCRHIPVPPGVCPSRPRPAPSAHRRACPRRGVVQSSGGGGGPGDPGGRPAAGAGGAGGGGRGTGAGGAGVLVIPRGGGGRGGGGGPRSPLEARRGGGLLGLADVLGFASGPRRTARRSIVAESRAGWGGGGRTCGLKLQAGFRMRNGASARC